MGRGQGKVGDWNGITLVDDFAQHPTAVAGAIAAMRLRYPRRRLWAVFEPRSNTSRRKVFQREYVQAFTGADEVIIAGVFRKETDQVAESDLFSPEHLVADLVAKRLNARTLPDAEAIRDALLNEGRSGDVILLMSNGGFGGLREKLASGLRSGSPS